MTYEAASLIELDCTVKVIAPKSSTMNDGRGFPSYRVNE